MDSRIIKIIAVISMLIDHIGAHLFPEQTWLRAIGRIAFPLFCFLIAYGCIKTRNINKFFLRLFIFAFISQILIFLARWEISFGWLNVFFTLASGVLCIILLQLIIKHNKKDFLPLIIIGSLVAILVIFTFAETFRFDYGIPGILLIILFFFSLERFEKNWKLLTLPILTLFNLLMFIIGHFPTQWYSMLAILFLLGFKDRKLKISKWERWAFYIFYPLHIIILILISRFI